jgi:adenine-specific DNA-methyltransferase
MARSRKASDTDVENYAHDKSKRLNIPTTENQGLVHDDDKAVRTLLYPRNRDFDPQLVWRGKDEEDLGEYLRVASPPIYIQEKIHPRVIVEDLKRRTREQRVEEHDQFDFFADFNGLPEGWEADATASYYHDQGNWQNRMILGDALLVMASLADREGMRGKVQCIYMDPPYGIKFNSNWQPSTKSYDVRDGSAASITREPEVVRAFRDTWSDGINSYLSYLRDRLTVARDLLTDSGSIFVQIGDENAHVVRALMDEVFQGSNFVSLIAIEKSGGSTGVYLSGVVDYILWYARDVDNLKYRGLFRQKGIGVPGSKKYNRLITAELESRPLIPGASIGDS